MNFFRQPTVEETVKDTKRTVSKAQRELGRDSMALDREEKQIMVRIKDAQRRGNEGEMKILAKQVVQIRKNKEKLMGASSKLGTVKAQASMMKANNAVATAMTDTSKAMQKINKTMNPEAMQAKMLDFQRMTAQMNINEEMLDDALGDAFDSNMEEESDEIVRKVLDEIGVDTVKVLGAAPTHQTAKADAEEDAETDRIMKELLGS